MRYPLFPLYFIATTFASAEGNNNKSSLATARGDTSIRQTSLRDKPVFGLLISLEANLLPLVLAIPVKLQHFHSKGLSAH